MYIEIDYNPDPQTNQFFISVGLSDTEAISFDCTTKGKRIIKQVLTTSNRQDQDQSTRPTSEWDVIQLKDGKFIEKYHVAWTDEGKQDQVNGEVWETVWEKPLPKDVSSELLQFSLLVCRHYEELEKFSDRIDQYQKLIADLVDKYKNS